jgi:phenylalanyl-tRNA synthetase beta chain
MKISYKWLKEYIDIELPPEEVADILTNTGLEVEGVESFESVEGGLEGLVVGQVKMCKPHPGADRLSICTVDIGGDGLLPVVCGAPNVKAGQKVVFAPVGTTLHKGDEQLTLKKVKIRGEVSEGMICAEDEIGLGDSHEGIMVLDPGAKIGLPARDYFGIETDTVFELGLTPNRIDGASHIGAARDLAAFLSKSRETKVKIPDVSGFKADNHDLEIPVYIENPEACKRYAGVTITGVHVGESPDWLKERLRSIGQHPINNIVDITNFVLHETGQPLHAFDADRITGRSVHVKTLGPGTEFITLDEEKRSLSGDDLMICSSKEGMCIAGVFGGLRSGVSSATKNLFLESACFDPVFIRRTARRHGLNTDASFRFERGVDPEMIIPALKRAAILIRDIAGGRISSEVVDEYPVRISPHEVYVNYRHVDRLIGKKIERRTIHQILASLDIILGDHDAEGMHLTVPAFRVDVTREADVIEEILRIYGYNNVEFADGIRSVISHQDKPDKEQLQQIISDYLSSNGFHEIMCNSLSREAYFAEHKDSVPLFNPLSTDLNRMRTTLLYGGLETVQYNVNRKRSNLNLYEFGNTYHLLEEDKTEDLLSVFREEEHLALFMTGQKFEGNWLEKEVAGSFYDMKAFVENLLERLGIEISVLDMQESGNDIFSQGMVIRDGHTTLAEYGILAGPLLSRFDLPSEVFYADLDWARLVERAAGHQIISGEIPRFPEVRRDLSMIVDQSVRFSSIRDVALAAGKELLKSVTLFDVYESDKLPPGKKSYAVGFTLQDLRKTLTDKEIDRIMKRIQAGLVKEINAEIRKA